MRRFCFMLVVAVLACPALPVFAQISKGHQILIDRGGLRLGLSTKDNGFNVTTLQNSGLQGPMFEWGKWNPTLMGAAPGVPWGRWATTQAEMPPQTTPYDENPYMSNCVAIQLEDEQDLNNAGVRAYASAWLNAVRASYPNTLLYVNNWGGQIDGNSLVDFIQTANPDMLSQDTYPWVSYARYGGEFANGYWPGGSPRYLYDSLRPYRAYGLAFNKPNNLYTQTFVSSGEGFRTPSDSEMRLNYFAGVAFGFTSFMNFDYNRGSNVLFSGPGDQFAPTALHTTFQQINGKLAKLSPAITRLKPRSNYIALYDASMLYYPGEYLNGATPTTLNSIGGDFVRYPANYSSHHASNDAAFVDSANPGWFRSIDSVSNTVGTKNNGLKGDVWVMWFKPLDESFDGSNYNDERYVMVLNGLSDPTGTGAECHQQIKMSFENGPSATQSLRVLNQSTGAVDNMALLVVNNLRQATFELDGGEMVLFKYNTGAPFVGIDPPTGGNAATTYTWIGGNGDYRTSTNWSPTRTNPAAADILLFNGSQAGQAAPTVTVSGTDVISQLRVTNNASVTLTPTTPSGIICQSTGTLNSGNAALQVAAGSTLKLTGSTANTPMVIALQNGAVGSISGNVWMAPGVASAYHRLASRAAGSLVFRSGGNCYATCSAVTGPAGGPFGQNGGVPASHSPNGGVVFEAGSEFVQKMQPDAILAAGNYSHPQQLTAPDSMVTFQPGGLFNYYGGTINLANRPMGDLAIRVALSGTAPSSMTNLLIDNTSGNVGWVGAIDVTLAGNLTITPGSGNLTLNASVARNFNVSGNVSIGSSSQIVLNANDTLVLNGTSPQIANFAGATVRNLRVNNPAGVTLTGNATVSTLLNLAAGEVVTNGNTLTAPDLPGLARTSGFVRGALTRSIGTAAGSRLFPVGTSGQYSPVDVNFTAGSSGAGTLSVAAVAGDHPSSSNSGDSINRYWSLTPATLSGYTADLTFSYLDPSDLAGGVTENAIVIGRYNGSSWQTFTPSPLDTANNTARATGVTQFSDWTLGEPTAFQAVSRTEEWALY